MEANPRLRLSETAETLRSCTGEDHFDYLCQHGCSPAEVADEIEDYLKCSTLTDHLVTEVCSNCESEIEMRWSVKDLGYKATCPVCGERLMLCDECLHAGDNEGGRCDYDSKTDTCFRREKEVAEAGHETPSISREAELKYLEAFAYQSDFGEELSRKQLRALWTAYCFHHNLDVDTAGYDNDLLGLWSHINKAVDAVTEESDWSCYDKFDGYMCVCLV